MAKDRDSLKEEQLVVFDLAKEVYGVDIATVREIIRMQAVTKVPQAPEFVEGVINLRGRIIPVVDLRKRFGLHLSDYTKETRISVVEIDQQDIGLIVDGVSEVLRIPSNSVEPASSVVTTSDSSYIRGIAKLNERLVILLDLDKVLSKKDRKAMSQIQASEAVETAA